MSKSHEPQAEELVNKQVPEATFNPEQDSGFCFWDARFKASAVKTPR